MATNPKRVQRTEPLSVRVSREEKSQIEEAAAKAGLGLSAFLRNCVMVATGHDSRFRIARQ